MMIRGLGASVASSPTAGAIVLVCRSITSRRPEMVIVQTYASEAVLGVGSHRSELVPPSGRILRVVDRRTHTHATKDPAHTILN